MTPTNAPSEAPTTRSIIENPKPAVSCSRPAPTWDGLSDEHGRLVIDEEEEKARRDGILRMLAVIRNITDESDTDEVWDEFDRALERSH